MPPRQHARLGLRAQHRVEQPGPDDLVGLRPQVHRVHLVQQVAVQGPPGGQLRAQRRRGPGVHHIRIPGEPARLAALARGVARRGVGRRVHRQRAVGREDGGVVARLALAVQRVPHRDRHAEEPLPADQPVPGQAVHPVLVADPHVRRVPAELPAAGQQHRAQPLVVGAVADVPLPGGDDLQRLGALLVEVHRVPHRVRAGQQVAGRAEHRGDPLARRLRGVTRQLPVGDAARPRGDRGRRAGQQAPVPAQHRARGQPQVPPPDDVAAVAERAHHGDPGALGRVGQVVRQHRHLHPEQRGAHGRPGQRGVTLVPGMGHQRHAGGEQLRPGRHDRDGRRRPGGGTRSCASRRRPPGPPPRPGPPRSGTSRPTATAPRPGRPRPWPGCAGRRAGRWPGSRRRWSGTWWTSPPTAPAAATPPRRPARPGR